MFILNLSNCRKKHPYLSNEYPKNGAAYSTFPFFRAQSYEMFLYLHKSLILNKSKKKIIAMSKFLSEFKTFAVKGNAVDMAVGVIIGGAFGKIVSSIVNDIIMPPIGWLIGGVNFTDLKVTLPSVSIGTETMESATINYGNFLQTLIDFTIIAFCVFLLVKGINRLARKNKEKEAAPAPPQPSAEERLLTEIRDLLKEKKA